MKKLLILMLVLGLASVANAHFIFTVNGEVQEPEYWLEPSEILELDLELSADEDLLGYTLDYVLSNEQAELITDGASGSYPELPPMTDIKFPMVFEMAGSVVVYSPQHVQIAAGQVIGSAVQGPGIVMDQMYVHCLELTDVLLEIIVTGTTIVGGEQIPTGTVVHTLLIHQIPEPATMLLLGLGGLLLRRRK